jgi:hypothetical protein
MSADVKSLPFRLAVLEISMSQSQVHQVLVMARLAFITMLWTSGLPNSRPGKIPEPRSGQFTFVVNL